MSGTPTQTEIETMWANAVDILETFRALVDGTLAGSGGKFDTLLQDLEGEYLPAELANFAARFRQGCSGLMDPALARQVITPCLLEFARLWATQPTGNADEGFGSGYRTPAQLWRALYDWFVEQGQTVESRNISFGTPTAGGSNVGNGAVSRLNVDENGFAMEAVTVERKMIRCRQDASTGVKAGSEVFEILGDASSYDNVLRASSGSGITANAPLFSRHAGPGNGGSLLNNGSFGDFTSGNTPKFTAWTETANGAQLSQSTTVTYRPTPGSSITASLEIDGSSGTVTITQPLTSMRRPRLDPDRPYFLRAMVKADGGTAASGGTFQLSLGSQTVSQSVAGLSAGWNEVILPIGQNSWFRRFNQADLSVVISWDSPTSGTLHVADVVFAPMDWIDGGYFCIRQNANSPTDWQIDDLFYVEDSGGAPATAKIQYWAWVAGLGYLPSTTGVPTFSEP
jgi:hypothetical protein